MAALILAIAGMSSMNTVHVRTSDELSNAARSARPGTTILLEAGDYRGGVPLSNLHGKPGEPITIRAADPAKPPVLVGGGSSLQFSNVSYLVVADLVIDHPRDNGLNVDDGGTLTAPSHHVTLRNLRISDLPSGIHNGIKLSGVDDFRVEECDVERWGGSAIDMVGCHRGVIAKCRFGDGGNSAVQCKGGTSDVVVRQCRFEDFGERGVNIGGSTGLAFFRPPIESIPVGRRYECREIAVEGNVFLGGGVPVAFVGADGAMVRFNTIVHPGHFALRILQETRTPDFIRCRNGVFADNLIVFRSDDWGSGGVNVGDGTDPATFRFGHNFWYCEDRPTQSRPSLPTQEADGVYGLDPRLGGDLSVAEGSPAIRFGAQAWQAH